MVMARMIVAAGGNVSITIAASARNPDIAALARAVGWNGSGNITCTVNSGVDVASLSISGIPHDRLTIINKGRIGGIVNGGTGIYTRVRIRIDNSAGTIFGGGGKGGTGGGASVWLTYDPINYKADAFGGSGGNGQGFSTSGSVTLVGATGGAAGTTGYTERSGSGTATAYGGTGGTGGAVGQAGGPGSSGSYTGTGGYGGNYLAGGAGIAAGAYVDGNSYVTWVANGTRLGSAIN